MKPSSQLCFGECTYSLAKDTKESLNQRYPSRTLHLHLQWQIVLSTTGTFNSRQHYPMQAYIDQEMVTMLYNISSPSIRRLRESHVLYEAIFDEALLAPTPPPTAAYAPAICTIGALINLMNAPWILEIEGIHLSASDGSHSLDWNDRFRPRHGDYFTVFARVNPSRRHPHAEPSHDESSFLSGPPGINLGFPHVSDRWCGSWEDAKCGLDLNELEDVVLMQRPPSNTPTDDTTSQFVVHIFARRDRHTAFGTDSTEQLSDQIVEQWRLDSTGDNSIAAT